MECLGADKLTVACHRAAEASEPTVQQTVVPPVIVEDPSLGDVDDWADILEAATEGELLLSTYLDDVHLVDVDDIFLDDDEPYVYLRSEIQKVSPNGTAPDPAPLNLTRDLGTDRLLRHYLNGRWKDSEALLPSQKSERVGTEQVRNVVRGLAQETNVEPRLAQGGGTGSPDDVTPHTLRHSVFYRMFVEGDAKLKEVSLRLRHGSVATTERIYAHVIRR